VHSPEVGTTLGQLFMINQDKFGCRPCIAILHIRQICDNQEVLFILFKNLLHHFLNELVSKGLIFSGLWQMDYKQYLICTHTDQRRVITTLESCRSEILREKKLNRFGIGMV
jgi:hypothetical protein